MKKEVGGAQGVLVTAVSPKAFEQALGMVGRGGTVSLTGLPPGDFPLSIFATVLNGITVRGSIVGTRLDLQEALAFAAEGKVKATVETAALEDINDIFARMHRGDIQGRIVLDFQGVIVRSGPNYWPWRPRARGPRFRAMTTVNALSEVAALMGDPARASMLSLLMDGRAHTASELALTAGITAQTASGHLSRMVEANLLAARAQGRNRFYRLFLVRRGARHRIADGARRHARAAGLRCTPPGGAIPTCASAAPATTTWRARSASPSPMR